MQEPADAPVAGAELARVADAFHLSVARWLGLGAAHLIEVPKDNQGRFPDWPTAARGQSFPMKHWMILLVAAGLEVGWAIGLKYTHGFTRLWPSVGTIAMMAASMYLLAAAARVLPIGTAYAVWTGIGAVGTAVLGIALFHEPANAGRIACIALIVGGVAGLKVFSP